MEQSGLPTEVMGVPVLGNWLRVVIYFLCLIANIVGEECYMRHHLAGQELAMAVGPR